MSTERFGDETGVALITALLAAVILGGVAVVLVASAQTNLRATAASSDFDDAIHTAEAGADLVVDAMNDDRNYSTGHAPIPGAGKEWAIEQATEAYEDVRATGRALERNETLHDGHFSYGIRLPVDDDEDDEIFGVGIVEGRERQVRVVHYGLSDDPFTPQHAVLTQGDLKLVGGPDVLGNAGAVHSNRALELGSSSEIAQTATSSSNVCMQNGAKIGAGGDGTCQANQPEIRIPTVRARDFYHEHENHVGNWYDLCSDGTVRRPSTNGPCDPTMPSISVPAAWSFHSGHREWRAGNGEYSGIYYVHRASATRQGGNADFSQGVTLFIEDVPGDASTGNFVTGGGGSAPGWRPYLEAVAVVADRDIEFSGNISSGAVIAGEQFDFSGSVGAAGSGSYGILIAQDLGPSNGNTTGSPVATNRLNGTVNVSYDGGVTLPILDGLRVGTWNEL